MTREETYKWMRRIYGLIEEPEMMVLLKKSWKFDGTADAESNLFALDPRGHFLCAFIHECLHLLLPYAKMDANEGRCSKLVQKLERGITNSLSDRQWRNLIYRIGNKMWGNCDVKT